MLCFEVIFDVGGNFTIGWCLVYTKIEHKDKLLVPKWDSLKKHVGKRKNE
jgi:hypothetical protein